MQGRRNLPVLLVAYKRPEMTRQAIQAILKAGTSRVYFAVDGPLPGDEEEAVSVEQVRNLEELLANGGCEVKTLFRPENRGCARGVSEAITWFFENEEAGIILEDDCVPAQGFFTFCEHLVRRYDDDPAVKHISGNTRVRLDVPGASYFFSRYPQVWGWATWRDAWQDFRMYHDDFEVKLELVLDSYGTERERVYWEPIFRDTFTDRIDSWAYRWAFTLRLNGGLSAYPAVNTVENVGFGSESTHTGLFSESRWLQPPAAGPGEIREPADTQVDEQLDLEVFDLAYGKAALPARIFRIARSISMNRMGGSKTG